MPGLEGGFRMAPAAGLPLSPARYSSRPAYSSLATLRSVVPAAIRPGRFSMLSLYPPLAPPVKRLLPGDL